MVERDAVNVREVREEHPQKAYTSMLVSVAGSVSSASDLHCTKAISPMLVKVVGRVSSTRAEQPLKDRDLVGSGERSGEGELHEANIATGESESADGEVDVGEGGATVERAEANGREGRGECEGGEGVAATKGALADAGERGGQRELGERCASLKGICADGDETAGKHASGQGSAVAEGIAADESHVGEVAEQERLGPPYLGAASEGFRLAGRSGIVWVPRLASQAALQHLEVCGAVVWHGRLWRP